VVADLNLANANVYYEIGIRHAARRPGCVLIAPDWATLPFDVQQIRRLTYPSAVGGLSGDGISAIHHALREPLRRATAAESPVYQLVPGRHVDFLAKPAQRAPQDLVSGQFGGPLDDDHPPAGAPHGGECHCSFTFQVGHR
jgi:hypothetical protein